MTPRDSGLIEVWHYRLLKNGRRHFPEIVPLFHCNFCNRSRTAGLPCLTHLLWPGPARPLRVVALGQRPHPTFVGEKPASASVWHFSVQHVACAGRSTGFQTAMTRNAGSVIGAARRRNDSAETGLSPSFNSVAFGSCFMSWDFRFTASISAPGSKPLATLRDAATFITALPAAIQQEQAWQNAVHVL